MTGTKDRIKGKRKVEIRGETGSLRPYYWSWYGVIFGEPVPADKSPKDKRFPPDNGLA